MIIALLLALSAAPASPEMASGPQANRPPLGEPPIKVVVQGVSAERTIAEFMDVCFRQRWNVDAIQSAVKASEFAYVLDQNNDNPNSFTWKSKRGYLALNVNSAFSQCALSIGSIQPRTGQQLLAMLKPVVEAELGQSVESNADEFYLEWTNPGAGYVERITLAGASSVPKQAIWYVFDKTALGAREKLKGPAATTRSKSE